MNAADLDVRYETLLGDPFVELIHAVQSKGFDLVLAGVRGQRDRTQVELHLSLGAAWKEVSRLSQHLKLDLVTMGVVGRSLIQGLLLGNTAEKLLRTCDCSILMVKPDGFVPSVHPANW
jgi:nucleotide-binding universal stress UspA family protein